MQDTSVQPFTIEQVARYLEGMWNIRTLQYVAAGIICAALNHVINAPKIWQALALLAISAFVLDIFTGVLRSWYVGRDKHHCVSGATDCPHAKRVQFNSRDLGSSLVKFGVYGGLFLLCTALDMATALYLKLHSAYAVSIVALAIMAGREITSNIENCKAVLIALHEPWAFKKLEKKIHDVAHVLGVEACDELPEEEKAACIEEHKNDT